MSVYHTKVLNLMLILICLFHLPQADRNLIPKIKRKISYPQSLWNREAKDLSPHLVAR